MKIINPLNWDKNCWYKGEIDVAPGPISRKYALQSEFDELKEKVETMRVGMEVLADVIKILSIKIYGEDTCDEPIKDIYDRCLSKLEDI